MRGVTGGDDRSRPRLLAARSEVGYVSFGGLALPREPEAVPAAYQRKLTSEARRPGSSRWVAVEGFD